VLVDTPGFDDSSGLDRDVVQEILAWLKSSMGQGLLLNGLVYMHRITDPRISGTARSNIRLFRELCGAENLHKVVLATTFWAAIDKDVGQQREHQLLDDPKFWKPMVEKGSRAFRLTQECLQVLAHITGMKDKFLVKAQEEMRSGQETYQTSAGRTMLLDLDGLRKEYDAKIDSEKRRQQALVDEADRQSREHLKKRQHEVAREHRRAMEKLEQEAQQREDARRRQEIHEKIRRKAEEDEMRRKIEDSARLLRQRQEEAERLQWVSAYFCSQVTTKRARCKRCYVRLDQVGDGRWCYREYLSPSPRWVSQSSDVFNSRLLLLR
jgi:hypothetical protein